MDNFDDYVAIVIDDKVTHVGAFETSLYYAIISNPIIIDLKKNEKYISVGDHYNQATGEFLQQKPYPSWIFSQEFKEWVAPVNHPSNGNTYRWNEELLLWEAPPPYQSSFED
jgi:hypothetical protein